MRMLMSLDTKMTLTWGNFVVSARTMLKMELSAVEPGMLSGNKAVMVLVWKYRRPLLSTGSCKGRRSK